jgi:uncharacterized protein YndB with AHSA1/START domain
MRTALLLFLVFAFCQGTTRAEDQRLITEGVVDAPPDKVWKALTTKEGMEAWMVAHAEIELKIGGKMRTHYDPKGKIGDAKTIENIVLCFDPGRMYSIKVGTPPEGFPFPNAVKHMWTVIYLDPVEGGKTRVRTVGLGFSDVEESKKMRAFFERGNGITLQRLQKHFAEKK